MAYDDDVRDLVTPGMDAQEVFDLVKTRVHDEEDGETSPATFDLAEGLYWFASHYYAGQGDPLYKMMCSIDFRPSPMANGPGDEDAQHVYNTLVERLR